MREPMRPKGVLCRKVDNRNKGKVVQKPRSRVRRGGVRGL